MGIWGLAAKETTEEREKELEAEMEEESPMAQRVGGGSFGNEKGRVWWRSSGGVRRIRGERR